MPLKKKVKSLDGIPEAFHSEYEKRGEEFVLKLEVDPEEKDLRAKVNEFRDSNVKLKETVDQLTERVKKFDGFDIEQLEEAKKALEGVRSEEEKELIRAGRIDELTSRRMENARKEWEKREKDLATRVAALDSENKEMSTRLSDKIIDTRVTDMLSALGVSVRKGALVDIKNRARALWKVEKNGNLVSDDLYDTDGKPMEFDQWGRSLINEAPHFFEAGGGSGANGGRTKREGKQEKKTIDGNDPMAFGRNLEGIAAGTVGVKNPSFGTMEEEAE